MGKVYVPSKCPEDWRCLLARPERHWRDGYSAKLLAYAWQGADGFPPAVQMVLKSSDSHAVRNLKMLMAFPEFKVALRGGRRASQSDVFVLARSTRGLVCMTVEGKMHESFGENVDEWSREASSGKTKRLSYLCGVLGLNMSDVQAIPYQLLHRAASALILAERFSAPVAVMLVHSFSSDDEWFNEFAAFARAMGTEARPNRVAEARVVGGRRLLLGWVRDTAD